MRGRVLCCWRRRTVSSWRSNARELVGRTWRGLLVFYPRIGSSPKAAESVAVTRKREGWRRSINSGVAPRCRTSDEGNSYYCYLNARSTNRLVLQDGRRSEGGGQGDVPTPQCCWTPRRRRASAEWGFQSGKGLLVPRLEWKSLHLYRRRCRRRKVASDSAASGQGSAYSASQPFLHRVLVWLNVKVVQSLSWTYWAPVRVLAILMDLSHLVVGEHPERGPDSEANHDAQDDEVKNGTGE